MSDFCVQVLLLLVLFHMLFTILRCCPRLQINPTLLLRGDQIKSRPLFLRGVPVELENGQQQGRKPEKKKCEIIDKFHCNKYLLSWQESNTAAVGNKFETPPCWRNESSNFKK